MGDPASPSALGRVSLALGGALYLLGHRSLLGVLAALHLLDIGVTGCVLVLPPLWVLPLSLAHSVLLHPIDLVTRKSLLFAAFVPPDTLSPPVASVVLLVGGHELVIVLDPDEAMKALDPSEADGSGLVRLETDTGVVYVRAEQVAGIRPVDPMSSPAEQHRR